MASSYSKSKGRGNDTFFRLPHAVISCPNYIALSYKARAMLVDIGNQFRGSNNGDLAVTWSIFSKRGWKSKTTIKSAIDELLYFGFIVQVQDGGLNVAGKQRPHLYALTWLEIDKIGFSDGYSSKSNYKVGDILRVWKDTKPPYKPTNKKATPPQLIKK